MMLAILLFASLFTIAHSNTSFVHPSTMAIVTGESVEDIDCRSVDGSDRALEADRPSRGESFGLMGSYECHRSIFSFKERDPFVERLLKVQSSNAKRVAAEVSERLRGDRRLLYLEVDGLMGGPDDVRLLNTVAAIYRNELNMALGEGRVARLAFENSTSAKAGNSARKLMLKLYVWRVDDAETMVQARLAIGDLKQRGGVKWLEL